MERVVGAWEVGAWRGVAQDRGVGGDMAEGTRTTDPLSARMKAASREAHSASDALVNARLAAALANRRKWGVALAHFYCILREVEALVERADESPALTACKRMLPLAGRTEAMEEDLSFYLGARWKMDLPLRTHAVQEYIAHLRSLEPFLLLPYAYHLHLGICSGGQILGRTARRAMSLPEGRGTRTFEGFGAAGAAAIKRTYKAEVDALNLEEEDVQKILAESVSVFQKNNSLIRSMPFRASLHDFWQLLPLSYRWVLCGAGACAFAVAVALAGAQSQGWLVR